MTLASFTRDDRTLHIEVAAGDARPVSELIAGAVQDVTGLKSPPQVKVQEDWRVGIEYPHGRKPDGFDPYIVKVARPPVAANGNGSDGGAAQPKYYSVSTLRLP